MGKKLKVVALGDLHCGHLAGLTPPKWHGSNPVGMEVREECWKEYLRIRKKIGIADVVLINGDCIDGRGEASGGTELLTTDRIEQTEMAIECLKVWKPKQGFVMTYGTAYHTGKWEDFESLIAKELGCKAHDQCWPEIGGVVFDMKHHVGSSSIPHSRGTAIAKEQLWNQIWSDDEEQPRADILLRSHVHYHYHCGGPDWLAMTLPPLQAAANNKYGGRRCSGHVDWGIVWFEIEDGIYDWYSDIVRLKASKRDTIKFN